MTDLAEQTPRRWHGLTIVVSMTLEWELQDGDCVLSLDLAKDSKSTSQAIALRFVGVTNLDIKGFGGGIRQISGLHIENISDQQWDRITYRVFDYEDGKISFLCRNYEIVRQYTI